VNGWKEVKSGLRDCSGQFKNYFFDKKRLKISKYDDVIN
jgi:hypothetical protein